MDRETFDASKLKSNNNLRFQKATEMEKAMNQKENVRM